MKRNNLGLAVHIAAGEWAMLPPGFIANAIEEMVRECDGWACYRRVYDPAITRRWRTKNAQGIDKPMQRAIFQ